MELPLICQCIQRVSTIDNISLVPTMPPGGAQKHFRHPCLPPLHPGHPFLLLGARATRALLLSAALRVWRRLCPLTHTSKSNLVVGATMKPLHNTCTGRTSPFQLCCVSAIGQHNLCVSFSMLHKSNSGEDIRTR